MPTGPENPPVMRVSTDDRADLELALLRRGVVERTEEIERCTRCHRTPLIGERIYVYDHETVHCELCWAEEGRPLGHSRVIHGPEFGHTMKITDRRAAA